ncbi:hypothetical protein B0H11DRAFT_1982152 [Mycena galericulata]|nr:hypothetical protein B0H11DRAFT_1982152 [Mycena galericulata]
MFYFCIRILVMANAITSTFAIPVDPTPTTLNASVPDFVHSWGPSVLFDWVDRTAYPNSATKQELCQRIGSQLAPLTFIGFWKDVGANSKAIAGATPWIAEAAVKYSR